MKVRRVHVVQTPGSFDLLVGVLLLLRQWLSKVNDLSETIRLRIACMLSSLVVVDRLAFQNNLDLSDLHRCPLPIDVTLNIGKDPIGGLLLLAQFAFRYQTVDDALLVGSELREVILGRCFAASPLLMGLNNGGQFLVVVWQSALSHASPAFSFSRLRFGSFQDVAFVPNVNK